MSRGSNIVTFPERSPIEEEAARWVVRLDGDPSEADRAAFAAWRDAAPQNAEAYARLKAHWGDLDMAAGLAAPRTPRSGATWKWASAGIAASLVAAVVIAATLFSGPAPSPETLASAAPVGLYTTEIGAQQRITLADGSIVTLNTASQIEARINDTERSVRLLSGEAYFEVAHDASRPFRVYAGDGVTVAIGTAFSVRLKDKAVELVVSQGKVSFSNIADKTDTLAYVSAGEAATFGDTVKVKIEAVAPAEIDRKLSWTEGKLEFAGEPLYQVVDDITRYSGQSISIDPDVANMRLSGIYGVGEVDRMLDAFELGLGLEVDRIDDMHVHVGARK